MTGIECNACGLELDEDRNAPREPCPRCGSLARKYKASMSGQITLRGSLRWTHIHEEITRHKGWAAVSLAIGAAGGVAAYALAGTPPAIVVPIIVTPLGIWARGRVTRRLRTITHGGSV